MCKRERERDEKERVLFFRHELLEGPAQKERPKEGLERGRYNSHVASRKFCSIGVSV
jgi:hypothetical protein